MSNEAPNHGHRFAVYSPTGVHIGLWSDGKIAADVAGESPGNTVEELVTLDHAQALVAAEREAIADQMEAKADGRSDPAACIERVIAEAIRARTPADAQAALEAVKREARNEGLREALQIAEKWLADATPRTFAQVLRETLALIEGDQTDDK